MILAIDSGNSRVKWGLRDGAKWLRTGEVGRSDLETLERDWRTLPAPSTIVASNVAGDLAQARLQRALAHWPVETIWSASQKKQCEVTNDYEDAAQLGPDRWAALIGAWSLYRCACLVVNCGTALTVDALSRKARFLGGAIAPGFDLMLRSLAQNTAGLKPEQGAFDSFPRNTQDAIYTGAISASLGVISHMNAAMKRAGNAPRCCVLSGGNAHFVKPHIALKVNEERHLVLEGLVRIA